MTGRVITGKEAASLGLVTRSVQDPMAEAEAVAKEILQRYVTVHSRVLVRNDTIYLVSMQAHYLLFLCIIDVGHLIL